MKRVWNDGLDCLILPPREDVDAAKALMDQCPEEWWGISAEPVPERWTTLENGDEWPVGYSGIGFRFHTGNGKSDHYAGIFLEPRALHSVLQTPGTLDSYLAKVRHALKKAGHPLTPRLPDAKIAPRT